MIRRLLTVLLTAGSIAWFLGGPWGIGCGLVAAVVVDRVLRRQIPAEIKAERSRTAGDLPLGADLLAAALRAGAPIDHAVAAVADALPGPLGARLGLVARSYRLGADPPEAWSHLTGEDRWGPDPACRRVATAAVRASSSGTALAATLTRLAGDLRADRAVAVEAAAQRSGVLIVLPLGVCFLPAFLLAGLVPVVIALLGDLSPVLT
jgi:Flp pilus assembly protein TadB